MKLSICHSFLLLAATAATVANASVPELSSVTMTQDGITRLVTVTYELANAPAVVTLDIETNCVVNGETVWASIGGAAVSNARGDVWRFVAGDGTHAITWRPDLSWPDHKIANGGARAVVTAWAADNTPDYMVVDVSSAAEPTTQRYYPAADFVPGGVQDGAYKTSLLLLRKIMAKDITWIMGSTEAESARTPAREGTHTVTLDANYYIGVFEITQSQWGEIAPNSGVTSHFTVEGSMRPVDNVCYNELRMAPVGTTTAAPGAAEWPASPHAGSFLDLLRSKTGLDFDLPSESQWEYAARSGHGSGYWGNGEPIQNDNSDENLDLFGRYRGNVVSSGSGATLPPSEGGTAVVGSYGPNAWGLYDMAGNVFELCLDWYAADISALGGAVNTVAGTSRIRRGGAWTHWAGLSRPADRRDCSPDTRAPSGSFNTGFRVVCTAGLL